MSNSPFVDCKVMSPNHSGKRTHAIDRITPHCVVGQLNAENIGYCFDDASRQGSCNYGIGTEGRVCLVVDEENRSWCSNSNANDQRAVTIECASDKTEPYAFNNNVYNKLIELCVDICKRNGKTKLLWIADKNRALNYKLASDEMLITVHRWFDNRSCPGDWLYERLGSLASRVTALLNPVVETPKEEVKEESKPVYRVQTGAYSYLVNALALQEKLKKVGFSTYLVKGDDGLYKVQTGAFKNYDYAYDMVESLKAAGFAAFITTKSGTPVTDIEVPKEAVLKEGDMVRMQKNAPIYGKTDTFFQPWVYNKILFVRDVTGDKIVISTVAQGPITGVVNKKYLTKI